MSFGLLKRCILLLLMILIMGDLTIRDLMAIGGILILCTRRNQPDLRRYLETAPVWLLQFTRMRMDAPVLEFDLPDMSTELIWGVEGVKDAKRWPRLPLGTMAAGDPVCIASEEFGSDLSPEERRFYQEMKKRPEEEWSRLERRRMQALIERLLS